MKIVVLDGLCLNPGDLSWDALEALGNVRVYDRTEKGDIWARAIGAEAVLTNKTVIDAGVMASLPDLKYIGVLATGYNVVDVAEAQRRGIVVTNIPAYSTASVAQTVFAHLLNITQRIGHYARQNAEGKWSSCPDFMYADTPLMELAGKTMGIVGLGNTGMAVARLALAFGMKVIALTSKAPSQLPSGITPAPLNTVFAESDVLSLHCPLTPETKHMVNADTLKLMKPTAIVINTGRGPLIDEEALARALNDGQIYAAGVDVLSQEPPLPTNPLLTARNCFVSPHIAWATLEARQRLMSIAADNLSSFLQGQVKNCVW